MHSPQETRDTATSLTMPNSGSPAARTRSDSLDIFTMSPLGSPSLDKFSTTFDNPAPAHLKLPELHALDLDASVSGRKARGRGTPCYVSPPSTPASPTSFSFSPPLRAYDLEGMSGGTSYGTDATSFFGSWSHNAKAGDDDDSDELPAPREDKGKAVQRESLSGLDDALESALENINGKGKAREIEAHELPFEFQFDFQHGGVIDLTEPYEQPVVRLSSGSHYRLSQSDQTSAGPSSRDASVPGSSSTAESFNVELIQHSPSPVSSPSSAPSCDALSSQDSSHSRLPTHRRSFSSLSIRSIRSSSSRSIASLRSAVSGAGIRGRVKTMAPAAKKLKGGLRKMFRRHDSSSTSFRATPDADGEDSKDKDDGDGHESCNAFEEQVARAEIPMPVQKHVSEASTDSHMTVTPAPPDATHIVDGIAKDIRVLAPEPQSVSVLLPCVDLHEAEIEREPGVKAIVKEAPEPQNWFNDLLPRELQLAVLRALVDLHEVEHTRAERGEGSRTTWTARVAGRTRWVGRDKGMRELVKFTRVSKTWQTLAFDGQLWSALHLTSVPPHLAPTLLLRLAEHAGSFVRSLDLRGWSHLDPMTLRGLVRFLAHDPSPSAAPTPPFPPTNLTHLALRTCTALTAHSLHHVLLRAPALRSVDLRGLGAVTNITCGVLAAYCPQLARADLRRCMNMDGEGLAELVGGGLSRSWASVEGVFCGVGVEAHVYRGSNLRVLRASGVRRVDEDVMTSLAQGAPDLEVLDLSGARELTDDAIAAFVAWDESWDNSEDAPYRTKVRLSAREAGRDPTVEHGPFFRRVTHLRHLCLSACPLLTDEACTHLAYCVPQLEFLELAGIGPDLKDDGLVRLLSTTPRLRRLDLEDACDITDAVLDALTPSNSHSPVQPGHALEHLVLSYALNVSNETLLTLIRSCTRLTVLECDNTRISAPVVREFVRLARERRIRGAELVAVDCRSITEALIKDLAIAGLTRARRGYRHYEARTLGYVDKRDGEGLGAAGGMDVDDCDDGRILVKSFWSWQGVDALRRERERRRKLALTTRRNTDAGEAYRRLSLDDEDEDFFNNDGVESSTRPRWLGQWTRASGSGSSSPASMGLNNDEDRTCTIM